MKKIIGLVLCVIVAFTCLTAGCMYSSAEEETKDNYKYVVMDDGTVKLTEYQGENTEVINIPSEIDGKKVTVLGNGLFEYTATSKINIINIPKTVNVIEQFVLKKVFTLKEIKVDDNNNKFFSEDGILFNKAKSVLICYPNNKEGNEYTVPNGVKTIGLEAFQFTNVKKVILPESVKKIDIAAFKDSALETIKLGNKVEYIGKTAFWGTNLTTVFIPKSVKTIGRLAFGRRIENNEQAINYTIYGCKNSCIQNYCKKNNLKFIAVDPAAPKKTTVRGAKGKIKVNYKKVKRAKGFQVKAVSGKKKTVKIFKTKKSAMKSLKGLKKGTYKVKVRAFNTYNGEKIYGPWTKAKTVKVK